MNYIKILSLILIIILLSNCNDDSGSFTTINEPSTERLEQLAYHYGNWEVIYHSISYENNIATDTFKRHYYMDFQPDGYAPQTPIDVSLKEDYYWNLSQDATEMIICTDFEPANSDAFLGCSTYQIMEQTDTTQLWQQTYYAIQGVDSTLYVTTWDLTRQ
ncbi:MAG: hypothetical protein AB8G11_23485 [Saprospiraceae bacterium]